MADRLCVNTVSVKSGVTAFRFMVISYVTGLIALHGMPPIRDNSQTGGQAKRLESPQQALISRLWSQHN
jgi:hypothetical protein